MALKGWCFEHLTERWCTCWTSSDRSLASQPTLSSPANTEFSATIHLSPIAPSLELTVHPTFCHHRSDLVRKGTPAVEVSRKMAASAQSLQEGRAELAAAVEALFNPY